MKRHLKTHVNRRGACGVIVTEGIVQYWFTVINKAVFSGRIAKPIIIIKEMRKYVGWCRVKSDGEVHIEISTQLKQRSPLIATVAHEMVHIYQFQNFGLMDHGQIYKDWKKFFKKHYDLTL